MMIEAILLGGMNKVVDKSVYSNNWYKPGSAIRRLLWLVISGLFYTSHLFPFNGIKLSVLRLFGAKIGRNCTIKPGVKIKYPWFLEVGNYVGFGEGVWIDNLAKVTIGNQCTISQGAYILTGNHDYKSSSFDLIIAEVQIEDGVWIGAKSIVCPGSICRSHSVLGVGSILSGEAKSYRIYSGNPARELKERVIE